MTDGGTRGANTDRVALRALMFEPTNKNEAVDFVISSGVGFCTFEQFDRTRLTVR